MPKSAAAAADTSSSAAVRMLMVGAAADAFAALIAEPIPANCVAAAETTAGAAMRYDIGCLPKQLMFEQTRSSQASQRRDCAERSPSRQRMQRFRPLD
ncbi:hypothetical protein MYIN104542_28180 [Mycobacterium intermedium]